MTKIVLDSDSHRSRMLLAGLPAWVGVERPTISESADKKAMNEWQLSFRADRKARLIADRHYNRQKIGSPQFVPPGACVVLYRPGALWITSWPLPSYVKHAWPGAWINSAFRNESREILSSTLIRAAIAATLYEWANPPELGMVTFIDREKVRRKRDFGRCYRKAGFKEVGETKGGLLAMQLLPENFPAPEPAKFMQSR
jgi:hypothetical protein